MSGRSSALIDRKLSGDEAEYVEARVVRIVFICTHGEAHGV
jgi:hypothetical protein